MSPVGHIFESLHLFIALEFKHLHVTFFRLMAEHTADEPIAKPRRRQNLPVSQKTKASRLLKRLVKYHILYI